MTGLELVMKQPSQTCYKIVDVHGNDEEYNEGEIFATLEEAREECDRLHEKFGMETDDGWGNYMPYYIPQPVEVKSFFTIRKDS